MTIEEFDAQLESGTTRLREERLTLEAKVQRMETLARRQEEIADQLERLLAENRKTPAGERTFVSRIKL